MQVLNATETRLELEYRPMNWIIGLGIVCAILMIGLLNALFEAEFGGAAVAATMLAAIGWIWLTQIFLTIRLVSDRSAGTLRISKTSLFGEQFRERALGDLRGAEVETRFDENYSHAEPGLVLLFGQAVPHERVRIELFKPDPADLMQAAEAINTWLARAADIPSTDGEPAA